MESSLEARIARLESLFSTYEAERQIKRTLDQYVHSIDYGDSERWVDCFTPDGVWETRSRDGTVARLAGKAELERRIPAQTSVTETDRKHFNWAQVITFESDSAARVVSYFAVVIENGSRPYIPSFGRDHDFFVRCDDGRWRIRKRWAEIEVTSSDVPR